MHVSFLLKTTVVTESRLVSSQLTRNKLAMPSEVCSPVESGRQSRSPMAGGEGHSWSWTLRRASWKGRAGGKPGAASEQLTGIPLHSGVIDTLLRRGPHDESRVQKERTISLEDVTFI